MRRLLGLVLLLLLSGVASSQIVKTLPGYSGELPFKLETGYTTVGDVEFFYYFVESETSPASDPLLLYYNGGPGCSALNGFFYQIGPLKFNISNYVGGIPQLVYAPSGWSKTANILFVDAPVGAGFSYATTTEGWNTTDVQTSQQLHYFLRNWLKNHTNFQLNPVYLGSDSYAGIYTPMIAANIMKGNTEGLEPYIFLQGFSIGCPHTNTIIESNAKIPYAHRMALISDEIFEAARDGCNGTYTDVDPSNAECTESIDAIDECINLINPVNVLDPYCAFLSPKSNNHILRRYLSRTQDNFLLSSLGDRDLYCHNFEYLLSSIWANTKGVQEALHVRKGTVGTFYRCNITMNGYTVDTDDVVPYHQNLTNSGLQVLVFSGDHDMVIPHNGIEEWINMLGLTVSIDWRPWFINGQVAGYTTKYSNNGYRLTYVTIKGAGHSPQEFQRATCYDMFHRWIHYYPV